MTSFIRIGNLGTALQLIKVVPLLKSKMGIDVEQATDHLAFGDILI